MAEASCAPIGFGRSQSLRQGGGGGGARKGGWGWLLLLRGSEEGVGGGRGGRGSEVGAPVDGTDISGQVVPKL